MTVKQLGVLFGRCVLLAFLYLSFVFVRILAFLHPLDHQFWLANSSLKSIFSFLFPSGLINTMHTLFLIIIYLSLGRYEFHEKNSFRSWGIQCSGGRGGFFGKTYNCVCETGSCSSSLRADRGPCSYKVKRGLIPIYILPECPKSKKFYSLKEHVALCSIASTGRSARCFGMT